MSARYQGWPSDVAREWHGRRGPTWFEALGVGINSRAGRGLSSATTCLVGKGRRPAAAVAVRGRTRSHAALLAEVVAVAAGLVLAVGAATAASAEPRVDARDPAWGGRPGRDRRAIGERWRSGWAHVRSLPDRLTSTASVCRQLVVRCWKRSSRSSVPALPVSVASKLRVATAKVEHTRPSTSGQVFEYRPVGAPTPRL